MTLLAGLWIPQVWRNIWKKSLPPLHPCFLVLGTIGNLLEGILLALWMSWCTGIILDEGMETTASLSGILSSGLLVGSVVWISLQMRYGARCLIPSFVILFLQGEKLMISLDSPSADVRVPSNP